MSVTEIIAKSIEENSIFTRRMNIDAVKNANYSADRLSSELNFIVGILAGIIALFFEKIAPEGKEQKIVLIGIIIFITITLALGVINKYSIYLFHKNNEVPSAEKRSQLWMQGRNKVFSSDVDQTVAVTVYKEILEKEKSLLECIEPSSPSWPLNFQLVSTIITAILVLIYIITKVI